MQEEVTQKTIALVFKVLKADRRCTEKAMKMYLWSAGKPDNRQHMEKCQ